jgi:hypothetical protein
LQDIPWLLNFSRWGEVWFPHWIASAQLHCSLMKSQFWLVKPPFLKSQPLFLLPCTLECHTAVTQQERCRVKGILDDWLFQHRC